jgi:hypothetical protein
MDRTIRALAKNSADYGTAELQVHACLIHRCTGTSIFPYQDEAETARRWNS